MHKNIFEYKVILSSEKPGDNIIKPGLFLYPKVPEKFEIKTASKLIFGNYSA